MPQPQARLTDIHICTVPPPPAPPPAPFPSPIAFPGMPMVLVCKMPAARAGGDMALNGAGIPHPFPKGSMTVLIGKLPALRAGDMCASGGPVIPPCAPTVLTGG